MRTYFDGVVVQHRGSIVYEDYFGEGAPHRAHMLASVMRNNGRCGEVQVVPEPVVTDIRRGGDTAKFRCAELFRATLPGWSYGSMWWVSHNPHRAYMARGIHGQCVYIDPVAEVVIARFGSHPVATSVANDPITLPGLHGGRAGVDGFGTLIPRRTALVPQRPVGK